MTHKKRSPAIDISELEQAWVDQWGEAVKKTTAAKILDVNPATIWRMVQDGRLAEAPNGRILVRQMARWAEQKRQPRKRGLYIENMKEDWKC